MKMYTTCLYYKFTQTPKQKKLKDNSFSLKHAIFEQVMQGEQL